MIRQRRPHVSQQDRDALEDLGLVDYNEFRNLIDPEVIPLEAVTPS